MSLATILIVVGAGVLGILSGWLIPVLFKSRRPSGVWGDVLVCLVITVVLAYIEWVWILPALGFRPGWLSVAAAIGDPLVLSWIALWVMRKIRS
jgi:hypothetical protein